MRAMMNAGRSAAEIAKALRLEGIEASAATVGRWLREKRGPQRATKLRKPTASSSAPAPSSSETIPENIPDGTDLAEIERWMQIAQRTAVIAEEEGNVSALAAMLRIQRDLFNAKLRARRDAKPDPNDSPDMVAAAKRARDRLHKYVDLVDLAGARS